LADEFKFPAVVQQVKPALDAPGANHGLNGLANGHAEVAHRPEIPGRLKRIFLSAQSSR
jgi:hypothetical protein